MTTLKVYNEIDPVSGQIYKITTYEPGLIENFIMDTKPTAWNHVSIYLLTPDELDNRLQRKKKFINSITKFVKDNKDKNVQVHKANPYFVVYKYDYTGEVAKTSVDINDAKELLWYSSTETLTQIRSATTTMATQQLNQNYVNPYSLINGKQKK